MLNAVILISGSGTNLQAFIDEVNADQLPIDISLVISNKPNAYGLKRAQLAGIPTSCIDHHDFGSRHAFDQALMKKIDSVKPEVIILAGFMRILTPKFVNHYHRRLLNIHPSLLPKYTGTNTHQRALEAKDEWHGTSIHFVVPEVDAGPIILQGRIKIKPCDNAKSLKTRILKVEHQLYPMAVKWFAERRLKIKDQIVLLDGEISSDQLQDFDL